MSIRHFSGRIFVKDKAINLKVGGPMSEDGQQNVIAMDESTKSIRIIRCDVDALNFNELAKLVGKHFEQPEPNALSRAH